MTSIIWEKKDMPQQSVEYVKGQELPLRIMKKLKLDPNMTVKITVEVDEEREKQWDKLMQSLQEVHEKLKEEDSQEIEQLIEEAITETRKCYAKSND